MMTQMPGFSDGQADKVDKYWLSREVKNSHFVYIQPRNVFWLYHLAKYGDEDNVEVKTQALDIFYAIVGKAFGEKSWGRWSDPKTFLDAFDGALDSAMSVYGQPEDGETVEQAKDRIWRGQLDGCWPDIYRQVLIDLAQ